MYNIILYNVMHCYKPWLNIIFLHFRGENGPNGFVVIPINPTRCQFIWVYNCNLKV